MLKKYLEEMHHTDDEIPNLQEFLRKFREVVMWDNEEDHEKGLLRFDSVPPSPETAFVFKFEHDQLINMHTLGMKFCIDIYFFDKHGHFINKWMNVPPGHPGTTMEYGPERDELNSKSLARYAVEVVNPNCRPTLKEVSADAAYASKIAADAKQAAINSRNFKIGMGGMAASIIIPIAVKYGQRYLTKAGRECKELEGPKFNVCKSNLELKALESEHMMLKKLKSKCKDQKCKLKVDLKIDNLSHKIKQKSKQLTYEKAALKRTGG